MDGPGRLTIELVPKTCWFSNVRTHVSKADWEKCKRLVRQRSGDKCEICGGRGPKWPVEAHEQWSYDEDRQIQMLVGLVALCPDCHRVKHIGRAFAMNEADLALVHLAKVNRWSLRTAESYAKTAFDIWELRSQYQWSLDISVLALLGIDVADIITSYERKAVSPP
jgi:hypothetical protein